MTERCLAFVYARSDSRRLPGKALMPLNGLPLIDLVCERARRLRVDDCVLLTTDRPIDDELAHHMKARGVSVFRGDAGDVVRRTVQAIHALRPDWCLRVNGDCPLFEPVLALSAFQQCDADTEFISNIIHRRFPYGVAVEWFRAPMYCELASEARDAEREHVTQHLYRLVDQIHTISFENERDDSHLQLTIDTPADYARLAALGASADLLSASYWELFRLPPPKVVTTRVLRGRGMDERNK